MEVKKVKKIDKRADKFSKNIKSLEPEKLEKVFYIMEGMRIAEKSLSVRK